MQTLAKLAVRVINKAELPTRVRLHGKFPMCLNSAGGQHVAQRFHLYIHTRLLTLQCVNSIFSKSRCQQPTMCFCLLSSLQYRLIWYLCCTFNIWYFCLARRAIIQLCTRTSCDALIMKYASPKPLRLRWHSFSGCRREHVAVVFASKGCQYLINGCPQPIGTYLTQDAILIIVDALLTLMLRMWRWLWCYLFCQSKLPICPLCITTTK
jgi:hypothetical protein